MELACQNEVWTKTSFDPNKKETTETVFANERAPFLFWRQPEQLQFKVTKTNKTFCFLKILMETNRTYEASLKTWLLTHKLLSSNNETRSQKRWLNEGWTKTSFEPNEEETTETIFAND